MFRAEVEGTEFALSRDEVSHLLRNYALHLHASIEFMYQTHAEIQRGLSASIVPRDARTLAEKAVQDFAELYHSETCADFQLVSGDAKTYIVHHAILAARSPVFAAMLKPHAAESVSGAATLNDMDGETLDIMLTFMYCADASKVGEKAEELEAADIYGIPDLGEAAVHYLLDKVTVENAHRLTV